VDWDLATDVEVDDGGTLGGFNGEFTDLLAESGATGGAANRLHLIPGNHDPNSYFGAVWQNFIRGFGDTAEFVAAPPYVCFLIDAASLVPLSGFPGITLQNLAARDPGLTGATIHTELLDDTELTAMIQAIQANAKNQIVTAPRIAVHDGQRSAFIAQDFTPTVTRYNQTFSDAITGVVQNPISTFTGLTLEITPTITQNNRVILNLRCGSLGASAYRSQQFDADGLPADLEFPVVQTSRAYTEIEVADGQIAFVGGVTRMGQPREDGLPFLKDLPLIGLLFGDGNLFQDTNAELMVFITPRIVQQP
jgi:type II secretory pathway component GspD/PulD (secretin)